MYDYREYCPIAKASQLLCERWTVLIVRELLCGCTRFNQLRRYLPRISPTLLRARLAMLEAEGVVMRVKAHGSEHLEYRLTDAGRELEDVVHALGAWACRWQYEKFKDEEINVDALMRDLELTLKPDEMPGDATVLRFLFDDVENAGRWFVVVDRGAVEACDDDRGFDPDLYLATTVRTISDILIGRCSIEQATRSGSLKLTGSQPHIRSIERWFGLAPYASREAAAPRGEM